jgi:flavin reductase (DIM6/NTAB) family NADH-FMN oxidoreductase RutF
MIHKPPRGRTKLKPVEKKSFKPGNMLAPVPAVLVSCGGSQGLGIIQTTQEFVVNVPSLAQAYATDWCGMKSGRHVEKFAETGLTPGPALKVKCPIVLECPLNLECRVQQTLNLGSHTMFLAEVVAVQVTSSLLDAKGKLRLEKAGLLAFAVGQYFALGRSLGHFGFSVKKAKKKK